MLHHDKPAFLVNIISVGYPPAGHDSTTGKLRHNCWPFVVPTRRRRAPVRVLQRSRGNRAGDEGIVRIGVLICEKTVFIKLKRRKVVLIFMPVSPSRPPSLSAMPRAVRLPWGQTDLVSGKLPVERRRDRGGTFRRREQKGQGWTPCQSRSDLPENRGMASPMMMCMCFTHTFLYASFL